MVYDDAGERRLLAAVKALAPGHEAAIDRWTALRARERREAIVAATDVAAELLVTAAAAVVVTAPKERDKAARRVAVEAATALLLDGLRRRETVTRDRIAATLGFFGAEARAVTFDVAEALGGVDFLSPASLERAGLWAAGAGAGLVAAGAMVDIATGGVSLGGFAVLGAVGTALGAAGASGRKVLRRLRGQDEVRLGDAGVELLAARAVATIRAMLARGHAAVEPVPIESAVKESLERDAGPVWRASWASARGRAAWSELSRPRARGVPGSGAGGGRQARGGCTGGSDPRGPEVEAPERFPRARRSLEHVDQGVRDRAALRHDHLVPGPGGHVQDVSLGDLELVRALELRPLTLRGAGPSIQSTRSPPTRTVPAPFRTT